MLTRARSTASLLAAASILFGAVGAAASEPVPATTLDDASGLAPLGPGQAIAVHDAKHPAEDDRPRASLLTLPDGLAGLQWQALEIEWSDPATLSNDLESASAIPGSPLLLFAESGDDGSEHQRVFLVEVDAEAPGGPTASVVAET